LIRAQRDHLALAALPLTVSVEVDGLGPVLFCHATARDDEEIVLVNSPLAWFADAFVGVEERMVVCGHTHMPFDRLADGRRVVNPGSLGMPYGLAGHARLLGPARSGCDPAPHRLRPGARRRRAASAPGLAIASSSRRTS
jgi:hypothetical protein